MVEAANKKSRDEAAESPPTAAQTPNEAACWRRFLSQRWIAVIVVASVVIHGAGLTCYQVWGKARPVPPSPEVALGVFQFVGDKGGGGRITAAEFSAYATLLERADRAARAQLAARRFRVQQDVEQLLRQAHSADFEDPNLAELKRQLQEQVNQSLGLRGVADVIITNLKLTRSERAAPPVSDTADANPWKEKPAD
jgi:flagellar basal body-associated protein FliL